MVETQNNYKNWYQSVKLFKQIQKNQSKPKHIWPESLLQTDATRTGEKGP